MNRTFYFTSYSKFAEELGLQRFPAAETKSEYIVSCLKVLNKVISICYADLNFEKFRFLPLKRKTVDNREYHVIFPSLTPSCKFFNAINCVLHWGMLVFMLLFVVKKNDNIVFYHVKRMVPALLFAKKLKKFNLILEMEEVYSNLTNDEKTKQKELRLASISDAYIFPTQLMNESINIQHKPAVIIHGTYHAEQKRQNTFNDGKIHVVYAGTLDPRKGGASAAAEAALFLSKNYHIHILGFGSDQEIQRIQETVALNNRSGYATVTYDGLLSGEDYIRFIQSCDIGLSTQNPDAAFNATSFPSKILSYMANGLRVVSIRIAAVECSDVGDMITYYDEQSPENIAEAIMRVDMLHPYDSRKRISELDAKVKTEIRELLEQL